MSNNYVYCPMCGDKIDNWSGFWPDRVFQIRRSSVRCGECGFTCEVVVKVSDGNLPTVNLEGLRENAED